MQTCIYNLPIDICLEICKYLSVSEIYYLFYHLRENKRINNFITGRIRRSFEDHNFYITDTPVITFKDTIEWIAGLTYPLLCLTSDNIEYIRTQEKKFYLYQTFENVRYCDSDITNKILGWIKPNILLDRKEGSYQVVESLADGTLNILRRVSSRWINEISDFTIEDTACPLYGCKFLFNDSIWSYIHTNTSGFLVLNRRTATILTDRPSKD